MVYTTQVIPKKIRQNTWSADSPPLTIQRAVLKEMGIRVRSAFLEVDGCARYFDRLSNTGFTIKGTEARKSVFGWNRTDCGYEWAKKYKTTAFSDACRKLAVSDYFKTL